MATRKIRFQSRRGRGFFLYKDANWFSKQTSMNFDFRKKSVLYILAIYTPVNRHNTEKIAMLVVFTSKDGFSIAMLVYRKVIWVLEHGVACCAGPCTEKHIWTYHSCLNVFIYIYICIYQTILTTKTILRLPLKYNYRTQLDIKFHRIHTNER